MSFRKLLYGVITIICVCSIGVGVYTQLAPKKTSKNSQTNVNTINTNNSDSYEGKTQEELKEAFNKIFDNNFAVGQYDTSNVEKIDSTKEIVYTTYKNEETKENYQVNLNFPVINIKGDIASKFNSVTQKVFANKANEIYSSAKENTIYNVAYTGYINGDIMSVIIKATLKEGTDAQRTMVETYNYNLKTGEECNIDDVINQRGTSKDDVTKKINTQVKEAIKEANDIQVTGYNVYKRDANNDIYKVDNTETYFLGSDGALYIIYAYGNSEYTSEMDIIVI